MISLLSARHVPPLEAWSGNVQNGMSCMVTHIPENAQNGMMIPATENQEHDLQQHQPSGTHETHERAIPSVQAKNNSNSNINVNINNNSNNNNNNTGNDKNRIVKNCRKPKNVLVENLVDTTVLIIDEIWYNFPVHLNAQVIPLRLFVQETLRRSRTSWSTLQTALFYLMKIKQQIKILWLNPDWWTLTSSKDNNDHNQGSDPATCGRRMFLASLIIASKYLQDRNYANNAWSKICGLPVQEINAIERRFLKLIDYNLFIGEDEYKNWTNSLRSHIQANKGSEVAPENRQVVTQFEKTLQQPQAVQCEVLG